jgi:hypothetical protein
MATSSASAAAQPQANNRLHATAHLRFAAREPDLMSAFLNPEYSSPRACFCIDTNSKQEYRLDHLKTPF